MSATCQGIRFSLRLTIYVATTFLRMQCFERTVENLQVRMRPLQGLREGGGGREDNDPGAYCFRRPMGFRGASRGPMGFRGPIEMTLRNQLVEDRQPFLKFFGDHIKIL